MLRIPLPVLAAVSLSALALVACTSPSSGGPKEAQDVTSTKPAAPKSGALAIDGSDTVFPITSALMEGMAKQGDVSIGQAGTGAGMKKFIDGEIDIADASRPVTADEDAKLKTAKIDYYELAIALDGVAAIVNKKSALESITTAQLKTIWDKDSKVKSWKDVDPSWSDKPIDLYSPTSAHGTYDFFNETINGDKKNTNPNASQQAQYDALVTQVARDENALGYVGLSYALSNPDIKILKVDCGSGPVAPSEATIKDGTYKPLSRPLFIYVSKKSYDSKPDVKAFVDNAIDPAKIKEAVAAVKYVALPDDVYGMDAKLIAGGKTGSHLVGAPAGTTFANAASAALK